MVIRDALDHYLKRIHRADHPLPPSSHRERESSVLVELGR